MDLCDICTPPGPRWPEEWAQFFARLMPGADGILPTFSPGDLLRCLWFLEHYPGFVWRSRELCEAEAILFAWHVQAEAMANAAIERQGWDCSALVTSCELCRAMVAQRFEEIGNEWDLWPPTGLLQNPTLVEGRKAAVYSAMGLVSRLRALARSLSAPDVDGRQRKEPLSDTEEKVYRLICERGPIQGDEICRETGMEQSTLTSHIIPALKAKRGVRNKRGAGYYADLAPT